MKKVWTKQWPKQCGSAGDDYGNSTAVDSVGNVYVTGWTEGDLDVNANAGYSDIFLTKWNADGDWQWTRQWGSTEWDSGKSVAVDSVGNIYVTGTTGGGLDGNANAGRSDIFLTKWSGDGTKQWTKQWGSTEWDYGNSVAIDSNGNIYVTGCTFGDIDGNTNAGGYDIFLTKWNADGTKQGTLQWGSAENDYGESVAIDSNDNIYVTGTTYGDLDGNTNAGKAELFLTKLVDEK